MARRRFLAQLFGLPFLSLAAKAEEPKKKMLKIMMKSAWGSDDLICAIALARDWPIFATDPDFKSYARILRLKLHTPRK